LRTTETVSIKVRNQTGCPLFPLLFNIDLEFLARAIRQEIEIKIQKSVAFLYTSNKKAEKEIRQTIPFKIAPKIVKYLEINLTKEIKEFLNEHNKLLKRENQEDIRIWKELL
jgi:hypothetical protein